MLCTLVHYLHNNKYLPVIGAANLELFSTFLEPKTKNIIVSHPVNSNTTNINCNI